MCFVCVEKVESVLSVLSPDGGTYMVGSVCVSWLDDDRLLVSSGHALGDGCSVLAAVMSSGALIDRSISSDAAAAELCVRRLLRG